MSIEKTMHKQIYSKKLCSNSKHICGSWFLIVRRASDSRAIKMLQPPPRQAVKYRNSYRLNSSNPFNKEHVEIIMKEIMDNHFSRFDRFDSRLSATFCRSVTDEIIGLVKEKKYDRFEQLSRIILTNIREVFFQIQDCRPCYCLREVPARRELQEQALMGSRKGLVRHIHLRQPQLHCRCHLLRNLFRVNVTEESVLVEAIQEFFDALNRLIVCSKTESKRSCVDEVFCSLIFYLHTFREI